MPKPLSPVERRVTGVLIEKVLSTPNAYPLTLNALAAGCNQKNNRDPEMDLSEDLVRRTLASLQEAGLVVTVFGEGMRVEKYRTTAREVFALANEKQMAVLAELLLRGPQTKAELRTRASRMRHELSNEDIDQILADFAGREEPLVVNIGRAPGGRAERYAHTIYPEEELAEVRASGVTARPPAHAASAPEAAIERAPGAAEKLESALREIEALKGRVEELERVVGDLRGSSNP